MLVKVQKSVYKFLYLIVFMGLFTMSDAALAGLVMEQVVYEDKTGRQERSKPAYRYL